MPHAQAEMKRVLGLHEYLEIYDTVGLRYPAYEPGPKYVRSLEEVTHLGRYNPSKSL